MILELRRPQHEDQEFEANYTASKNKINETKQAHHYYPGDCAAPYPGAQLAGPATTTEQREQQAV